MIHQVEAGQRFSLCTKAGQGNLAWEPWGSQMPAQAQSTSPDPTAMCPTNEPSYTTVTHMERA